MGSRVKTFGVWLGPRPMPPHSFDEVVTDTNGITKFFDGAELPGGLNKWRTLSDIVRIHEASHRPGWLYHDFDCRLKTAPAGMAEGKETWFARHGMHLIDGFMFKVGEDTQVFRRVMATYLQRCMRGGKVIVSYCDMHHVLNELLLGRVKVIEHKHFVHGV